METQIDYWDAHALLEWQVDLGISEAISESPVNRYDVPEKAPKPAPATGSDAGAGKPRGVPVPVKAPEIDPVDLAHKAVAAVQNLDDLHAALQSFEHCDLSRGARNLVFSSGTQGARVMVIDDAPSRDEDRSGTPFAGDAGVLFDKMLAAIDLSRGSSDPASGVYLISALPWRAPENRDPSAGEIAMMKPFLLKHIELAKPDVIVLMGNHSCAAVLGKSGVTRLRGQWQSVAGIPALPMMHPRNLLRTPIAKRDAWSDLLDLRARLRHPS